MPSIQKGRESRPVSAGRRRRVASVFLKGVCAFGGGDKTGKKGGGYVQAVVEEVDRTPRSAQNKTNIPDLPSSGLASG